MKRLSCLWLCCALCFAAVLPGQPEAHAHSLVAAPAPEPGYAKWGRLAVTETMKRYPNTAIIDYLHVGRTYPAPGIAQETFKLLLKKNGRIWAVYVRIQFEQTSEKLIRLQVDEAEGTAYSSANRFMSPMILSISISAAMP
ncbi:DUF3889 domain-containing protein [Brevibacillus fluminis]|uniref:DUF3889 domain-containing protein n=1 Tax=Brevibacillus fluminis TaxID=511487 RepID=UPI003F88BE3B